MNEVIFETKIHSRRFFKRVARNHLYSNWLSHIIAVLVVLAIYVGITQFGNAVTSVMVMITGNTALGNTFVSVFRVVSFLLFVPIVYGLAVFEINAVKENKCNLADLFYAFSSMENLNRAYGMFLNMMFRILVAFLPSVAMWVFISFIYFKGMFGVTVTYGNIDVLSVVLRTLFLALLFFGFVVSSKYYLALFISIVRPELEPRDCFILAKICMHSSRFVLAKLMLSFVPLFVLSLFTMGFLFVLYSFPYMLVTFTLVSKYLYEKEVYTKNTGAYLYAETDNEN